MVDIVFSIRHPVLVRGLLFLAERDVHRNVVISTSPCKPSHVQNDSAQNAVLLLLDMGLGPIGDSPSHFDGDGSQSHDTHDLRQAHFR